MAQPQQDQHKAQLSDLEIAQAHRIRPIQEVAEAAGIPDSALLPFGRDKAKLSADYLGDLRSRPDGRLILVTAITPTPAGEGKLYLPTGSMLSPHAAHSSPTHTASLPCATLREPAS